MSRSSRFIWRIVLAKVDGLPPCPVDLTEPQYAHLAFDPYCDVCFFKCHIIINTNLWDSCACFLASLKYIGLVA